MMSNKHEFEDGMGEFFELPTLPIYRMAINGQDKKESSCKREAKKGV